MRDTCKLCAFPIQLLAVIIFRLLRKEDPLTIQVVNIASDVVTVPVPQHKRKFDQFCAMRAVRRISQDQWGKRVILLKNSTLHDIVEAAWDDEPMRRVFTNPTQVNMGVFI
jgi:hypothetical protein